MEREIEAWSVASGGFSTRGDSLHVLVVSHFDRDHVNGLVRLNDSGFAPRKVIMPFLNPAERVMQLLRNVAAPQRQARSNRDREDDTFADQVAIDPEGVIGRLWPEAEVVLVGPDEESADNRSEQGDGATVVELDPDLAASFDANSGVRVSRSSSSATPAEVIWAYQWRVHRALPAGSVLPASLAQGLMKLLGLSPREVVSPEDVWRAISAKNRWRDVADLYRKLLTHRDLNPYSLVLWSGPGPNVRRVTTSRGVTLRGLYPLGDGALRPWFRSGGWLGTGDAMLRSSVDVDKLISYFGRTLDEVDVMNAPHHGSRHNSSTELYKRVPDRSSVILAPADGRNGFNHPHAAMVDAALTEGCAVIRVGDSEHQRFAWSVTVRA
ncbi:hypothetical protein IFU11_00045 [Plantibacter sp. CFBP 8804]|nr:hypothetical protein [Plantibacter sp. CFBP 8804]